MNESTAKRIKSVFLIVYVAISVATFYHTSWGFGTLAGAMPDQSDYIGVAMWWLVGALSAFSIDVGMGAIVFAILSGWEARWLIGSLVVLALFSAFAQLVFASNHAYAYELGSVAGWLEWLGYILDARTLILPLALPIFSLVYAFAAKIDPNKLPDTVIEEMKKMVDELEAELDKKVSDVADLLEENSALRESMQSTNGTLRFVDFGRALAEATSIKAGELANVAKLLGINPSYMMRGYNQVHKGDK